MDFFDQLDSDEDYSDFGENTDQNHELEEMHMPNYLFVPKNYPGRKNMPKKAAVPRKGVIQYIANGALRCACCHIHTSYHID